MNILVPNIKSSLSLWLNYINNIYDKPIELGLNRVSKVAQNLNILNKPLPFIFTVAGTNGKGTTCCMLETLLINSNYKVGVYSSPHLLKYTERIRIQGVEIKNEEHIKSFDIIEKQRYNIPLTYFEFSTLSALLLFKKFNLDIIILEVGLGGRLDATNIIDSDVSIITNVALDHIDLLGNNIDIIGKEKAGIFRSEKPAIIGEKTIPNTVISAALKKNTYLFQLGKDWFFKEDKNHWSFKDNKGELKYLSLPQIPLNNAATALAALRCSNLEIKDKTIKKFISLAKLPGRFQIIKFSKKSPFIILDVAHNPHAASYLASKLIKFKNYKKLHAVVGMLYDKDITNTLLHLSSIVNYWYFGTIKESRGASSDYLLSKIKDKKNSKSFSNIEYAWNFAINNVESCDALLVFGSFYTVAKVIRLISLNKFLKLK